MNAPSRPLRSFFILVLSTGVASVAACRPAEGPYVGDLQTRAEATDYVETSRYADVVEFMEVVAAASPRMHLETMGYTSEGRAIPLMVVGDLPDGSPEAVRASGKIRVYLQGNIHGGEVPGKEALLMLLREMALGERVRTSRTKTRRIRLPRTGPPTHVTSKRARPLIQRCFGIFLAGHRSPPGMRLAIASYRSRVRCDPGLGSGWFAAL